MEVSMLHLCKSRQRCAKAWLGFTLSVTWESDLFIKAVLSCAQTVAQVHERLPITKDRLSCSCPAGKAQLRSCHHALDRLPCPLVMRVSQRLECGSHAAAAAVLTIRRLARR